MGRGSGERPERVTPTFMLHRGRKFLGFSGVRTLEVTRPEDSADERGCQAEKDMRGRGSGRGVF